MSDVDQLRTCLSEFHEIAANVWQVYQDVGPGHVESDLFANGDRFASQIDQLLEEWDVATGIWDQVEVDALRWGVGRIRDLASRCATRSDGLCFITGEAGLVPRRDWHAAMEEGLVVIGNAVAALERQ